MEKSKSPYLKENDRLSKVIAAIQVMGKYKYYQLNFEKWAYRITGKKNQEKIWEKIFKEHPEFFRVSAKEKRASLAWRRTYPKRYNVDTEQKISHAEFKSLTDEQKKRISREILTNEDIRTLINTAIDLHASALKKSQDERWWIHLALPFAGAILGAFISQIPAIQSIFS